MSDSSHAKTQAGASGQADAAIVRPGQSLDDFQRAFWAHQIRVVESDDMDSLLVRVGMSAAAEGGNSSNSNKQRDSASPAPAAAAAAAAAASNEDGGAPSAAAGASGSQAPTTGRLEPFPIPLARIKKVIKSNDEVSMVSSEAPVLLARACEILIADLTSRAFLIADSHRRRTVQRSDVRDAIAQTDVFDFAIDILPRETSASASASASATAADQSTASV
ncbi:CCAAT- binding transcription factor component [Tilletia horrida]|nr:CCAAT- binding transcription factor component [Tilletia horrida]